VEAPGGRGYILILNIGGNARGRGYLLKSNIVGNPRGSGLIANIKNGAI